ncbi:hypothetical protein [Balneatrix alpica]|uniref:GIY-YIG nuclease family protein n=1 Tax=Balneatrix alpica TaxID=75684 RepID=A0ABV5ZEE2_9GAMM|nr:hypothetical protein [Balneatrix alpica]
MTTRLDLIPEISSLAQKYVTLNGINPSKTYDYVTKTRKFRGLPIIDSILHARKCGSGESWLYVAVPLGAELSQLSAQDRLYIGAQTQDRMFRGDGLNGKNFHHAEMRAGKGEDNLENYLKSGKKAVIYRFNAYRIEALVRRQPQLSELLVLLDQRRTPTKHLAWWFEQYALYCEPNVWRWNVQPSSKVLTNLFQKRT